MPFSVFLIIKEKQYVLLFFTDFKIQIFIINAEYKNLFVLKSYESSQIYNKNCPSRLKVIKYENRKAKRYCQFLKIAKFSSIKVELQQKLTSINILSEIFEITKLYLIKN